MFQVGGYEPSTVIDFEVPKRFGLRQTIADTLGVGGIMRALRTVPVLLDMCHDMEEVCPDAWLLQYVNPMAINCWAINEATSIKTVGLCHSVQHTAEELAGDIGVPIDEIRYLCAGINHMAFYLEYGRRTPDGIVDLYPEIARVANSGAIPSRGHSERSDGGIVGLSDAVRYEMFRRLGYFVTESSEHFAEYVPWFIKRDRPDLIERFGVPLDEYPTRCERQLAGWEQLRDAARGARLDDRGDTQRRVRRGDHPRDRDRPAARGVRQRRATTGSITNLPDDCIVEVPCLVDHNGVQPTKIGRIPPQLAGLMQTNINVQSLTVEALAHRQSRARVPRRDARPAHRRRARPRSDLGPRRRPARRPRRLHPRVAPLHRRHRIPGARPGGTGQPRPDLQRSRWCTAGSAAAATSPVFQAKWVSRRSAVVTNGMPQMSVEPGPGVEVEPAAAAHTPGSPCAVMLP